MRQITRVSRSSKHVFNYFQRFTTTRALYLWKRQFRLTLPLRGVSSRDVLAAVDGHGVAVIASTSRPPTLDDVYLQLTGDRLAAAA